MNQITRSLRGNSNAARDIAHHLHPYTNFKKHESEGPLTIVRGRGVHVIDDDGKEYIEGMAGLWSASLGFDNERIAKVAYDQMRQLPFYHSFNHRSHEPAIDLAEKLLSMAPVPMSKAFFANSGSEANDTVIKMVWYMNNALGRPPKKKIISRIKGYHGVTVASASLTGLPVNHKSFDLPIAGILHTSCPHHYRFAKDGETEEQFATRCAEELDALIQKEGPDTVAAMICEPVMGAGGVIVPPKGYYQKIQAVLKKHDVLLIADEVVTGFGRLGSMFGAQHYAMAPDLITIAKGLTSAYAPLSGVIVSDKACRVLEQGSDALGAIGHGWTYSSHPICAAAGVANLELVDQLGLVENARSVAAYFRDSLAQALADHPQVGEVRGEGLLAAVELVADKADRVFFDPALKVGPRLSAAMLERGVIARAMPHGDILGFAPPLCLTRAEADLIVDATAKAVSRVAAELGSA